MRRLLGARSTGSSSTVASCRCCTPKARRSRRSKAWPRASVCTPCRQAFIAHGGAQCGICTPGMVLAAVTLLERTHEPSLDEIRTALAGNLCRCTGYTRIFEAVLQACRTTPRPGRMRSFLPRFDLRAPANLTDALETLAREPGQWRPFAGGTDLMVLLEAGKLPAGRYLSLWGLRELRGIEMTDDEIVLGALTTYSDVMRSEALQAECPLVAARRPRPAAWRRRIAARSAATSRTRRRPPTLRRRCSCTTPTSISYRCAASAAWRTTDFISATSRWIWRPTSSSSRFGCRGAAAGGSQAWRKVGTRRAQAISKLCFASAIDLTGTAVRDIRIALGSVAPTVVRAAHAEATIRGRAITARDDRRELRCAGAATSRRSTICGRPPGIVCASRGICWRSSCRRRWRDSGRGYGGSNPEHPARLRSRLRRELRLGRLRRPRSKRVSSREVCLAEGGPPHEP